MLLGGMMDSDHYEVLGVKPDATQHKIRQEYHRLSKEYHPDRFLSPGERDKHRKLSERKKDGESLSSLEEEQLVQLEKKLLPFKKISFAYGTLSDSKKESAMTERENLVPVMGIVKHQGREMKIMMKLQKNLMKNSIFLTRQPLMS
ncbi:hypothetical protein wHma_10720 [Wolbachia pipientis]|nr:hypothetical protein wHma_10720 [Wolbachia pipientis]